MNNINNFNTPPSYISLYEVKPTAPPIESFPLETEDCSNTVELATRNWQEKTKNCKRNLIIQRVALAALIVLGVALVVAGSILLSPAGGAIIWAGMSLLIPGFYTTLFSTAGFFAHLGSATNYGDAKQADEIAGKLRDGNLNDQVFSDLNTLAKYGFIKEECIQGIKDIQAKFSILRQEEQKLLYSTDLELKQQNLDSMKALMAEWKAFQAKEIIPHLPAPLTVQS